MKKEKIEDMKAYKELKVMHLIDELQTAVSDMQDQIQKLLRDREDLWTNKAMVMKELERIDYNQKRIHSFLKEQFGSCVSLK